MLDPDFGKPAALDTFGAVATAPSREVDFVPRLVAPRQEINEDCVTRPTHWTLIHFWSSQLEKLVLREWQLSHRGGELCCEHREGRVRAGGDAAMHSIGDIGVQG